jgi:trehalose 6-phosphate phosphatase
MRDSTRRLLAQVARRYPCVVVSGRARADTVRRLRGVAVRAVSGNHGLDTGHRSKRIERQVRRWRSTLLTRLDGLDGITIEDKRLSLAVHYRRSRSKRRARLLIRQATASLAGARVIGGKQAINVVPATAAHKGLAVERLRLRLGCDITLYVGDDETDEDVFAMEEPGRLLTIRVGESRRSLASYFVTTQTDVDRLLATLLSARNGARPGPSP